MPSFIEPVGGTVHGGSICPIIGATGVNKYGTDLICSINLVTPPVDGRPRWRRARPAPGGAGRRSSTPRRGQGVERRYAAMFLAGNPAPDTPLPDKLVEQLDDKQIAVIRAAGGLPVAAGVKKPRRSDIEKLTALGALGTDGRLTQRGLDALRRCGELDDTTPVQAAPTPAVSTDVSSPDPAVNWNEYDQCETESCFAKPGKPCRNRRRARVTHVGQTPPTCAYPHKGRRKLPVPLAIPAPAIPAPAIPAPAPTEPKKPHVVTQTDDDTGTRPTVDTAELTAQAAYAKILTAPNTASPEDLAAALGASNMDTATRRTIKQQLARRAAAAKRRQPQEQPHTVEQDQQIDPETSQRLYHEAITAMDWSPYAQCDTCPAQPCQPCADLRSPGAFNHRPHPGRALLVPPAETQTWEQLGKPQGPAPVGQVIGYMGGTYERLPGEPRRYRIFSADGRNISDQSTMMPDQHQTADDARTVIRVDANDHQRTVADQNSAWRKRLGQVTGSWNYATDDVAGFDAATPTERAAIKGALRRWTSDKVNSGDATRQAEPRVNTALRAGTPDDDVAAQDIRALDTAFTMSQTKRRITTYRGFSNGTHILPDDWQTRDLTGLEWSPTGFTPVTADETVAEDYIGHDVDRGFAVRLHLPAGFPAIAIPDAVGGIDNEAEIVLPRDLTFRVTKDNGRRGDHHTRWLDVVVEHRPHPTKGTR